MKWLKYLDKIIQPKAEHCNDKIHEKQIVLYSVHLYQQVNLQQTWTLPLNINDSFHTDLISLYVNQM